MTPVVDRFCSACRRWHPVEVLTADADGFPEDVRPIGECDAAFREGLGRAAGHVMAIWLDAGHWNEVEAAAEIALQVNDPTETRP
jgi:hypothetical protein